MAHAYRTIVTQHADIRLTESSGTGLPVLMLHGSSASRRVFDPLLAGPVADRQRVIAMDLPGHGESSDARELDSYSIPALADCVAEVLAALRIERLMVFGWSLGGHVAIELLHRHPGICGLMLTGTPPVAPGPISMLRAFHTNWDMLLATKEHFSPRDVERYAHLCYGDDTSPELLNAVRRADGRFRPVLARSLMRADQRRAVEHADIPVAIVNGENDPIIRHSYFSGLDIPTLWDGRTHMIYDAGHAPFRDNPERFAALLLRFAAHAEAYQPAAHELARTA